MSRPLLEQEQMMQSLMKKAHESSGYPRWLLLIMQIPYDIILIRVKLKTGAIRRKIYAYVPTSKEK